MKDIVLLYLVKLDVCVAVGLLCFEYVLAIGSYYCYYYCCCCCCWLNDTSQRLPAG